MPIGQKRTATTRQHVDPLVVSLIIQAQSLLNQACSITLGQPMQNIDLPNLPVPRGITYVNQGRAGNGGVGGTGVQHRTMSPQTRAKLSAAGKQRWKNVKTAA